jgi:oxygen-independent coproporphyrinogen-3 oxidase
MSETSPAGIYLHIPFCATRCHYCNFVTGGYEEQLAARYVAAICAEIAARQWPATATHVDTIYLGGGTPTTLTPSQLGRILETIDRTFTIDRQAEITIEANPGSVTTAALREIRQTGINRISFGVQSFDDRELSMIGRSHEAEEARRAVAMARAAGFESLSLDLIAGLPEQTLSTWERNLSELFALAPDHLSVYLLELYRDAPLQHRIERGELKPIDDEVTIEMYYRLVDVAPQHGFEQYEISNWARPGFESRHNLKYWTGAPYAAFGVSAAGYDGQSRWNNTRHLHDYLRLVEEGSSPIAERTNLTEADREGEALFLQLRLANGVDLAAHEARYQVSVEERYGEEIARLIHAGLLERTATQLRITRAGKILANEVFAIFV